jgi:hypothetical protein
VSDIDPFPRKRLDDYRRVIDDAKKVMADARRIPALSADAAVIHGKIQRVERLVRERAALSQEINTAANLFGVHIPITKARQRQLIIATEQLEESVAELQNCSAGLHATIEEEKLSASRVGPHPPDKKAGADAVDPGV